MAFGPDAGAGTRPFAHAGQGKHPPPDRARRGDDEKFTERQTLGSPRGAERIAACWADSRKVPQVVFKPDWTKHRNTAPFKRNDRMLEALPIGVVVFPGSGISANPGSSASRCGASPKTASLEAPPFGGNTGCKFLAALRTAKRLGGLAAWRSMFSLLNTLAVESHLKGRRSGTRRLTLGRLLPPTRSELPFFHPFRAMFLEQNHGANRKYRVIGGGLIFFFKTMTTSNFFSDYALSSAIKLWYETGTWGCFCGFERWRATRCNFKKGSARPSLLFSTEPRIGAGRR